MVELGYPTLPAEMERRLEVLLPHPDYHTLVALDSGEIVGMIGLCRGWFYEKNGLYVRILALVVEAGRRGAGIGTALVRAGEGWAVGEGASTMMLNSGSQRTDAHAFYERMGYRATGLRFSKTLV